MREALSAKGTETQTDWKAINWRKANRTVRNLRQRIFRAAQEGNLKKVHSLQKLMLRSYSNRLVSVRRVTQMNAGKNTPGIDKLVLKTPAARAKMVDALAHFTLWKAQPVANLGRSEFPSWWIAVFRPWSKTPLNPTGKPSLKG